MYTEKQEIKESFKIPSYIKQELEEYLELTQSGKCKVMKWENIKSLLGLAKMNNRLTSTQVDFIIQKYNKEDI